MKLIFIGRTALYGQSGYFTLASNVMYVGNSVMLADAGVNFVSEHK